MDRAELPDHGETIQGILNKFKENIIGDKNRIKLNQNYDLICEISLHYLTSEKGKKLEQTNKYLDFLKLLKNIE